MNPINGLQTITPVLVERALKKRDLTQFTEGQIWSAFEEKGRLGRTLMHIAAAEGLLDAIPRYLLTHSRLMGDRIEVSGEGIPISALRIAARKGHLGQIPEHILECILGEESDEKYLILHTAVSSGYAAQIPQMIMRGALGDLAGDSRDGDVSVLITAFEKLFLDPGVLQKKPG
jgi:hypothetical protein